MDNYEFADIAKKIANTIPTAYKLGGWGEQSNGVYLFDCVCLIKSILWGFNFAIGGHGGAIYLANGVPDVGANRMITLCNNISYDFNNIDIGEVLWLDGHVGIYIGDRLVVEATTAWESKVVMSYVEADGKRTRNNRYVYKWIKHGTLPFINYTNAYTKINNLKVIDIKARQVKISFETDLPINKRLYSLDGITYYELPNDNIITSLIPDTSYKLRIKVSRKYTDNYTEKTIDFKTLDEPKTLEYHKDDIVIVNGDMYINPFDNKVSSVKNYLGTITNINNSYKALYPYQINNIGWVDEKSIKKYKKKYSLLDLIIEIIKLILDLFILPFKILYKIIREII